MGFLNDYLHFTSGTECPEPYRIWAGLSLLGAVMGRRFHVWHGRFQILPSLYVCLVGTAGSGKSTAKNDAKKIFTREFPEHLVSASFQSHQDIIDQMCNVEPRTWTTPDKIDYYTPFYIICNELSSLLSTDKKGMVEFLVDIYDENDFSTGYKTQRLANPEKKQKLSNPFVSVLSCAVPKWFMGNLKMDLFDGGLGRRLIIVYNQKTQNVDNPVITAEQIASEKQVVKHLHEVDKLYGEIKRTPDAMHWWKEWYHNPTRKNQTDPILMQFHETKPVQVLKVAMILAMSEKPFTFTIEPAHLQFATKLLDQLEPDIVNLTSGIGRNELAGVGSSVLEHINRVGRGAASMVGLRKFFWRYLDKPEFLDVINQYIETGELYVIRIPWQNEGEQDVLMLPYYFGGFMKKHYPSHPSYLAYVARTNGVEHNPEQPVPEPAADLPSASCPEPPADAPVG